jgi:hypothetical protein
MTMMLVVTNGPQMGAKFPLEGPVCRIGSGAEMTIRVEGLEPHTMTLQQRGGQWRVFNRSSGAFRVGNASLPPTQSAVWETGMDVDLENDVVLRLEQTDKPVQQSVATRAAIRSRIDPRDEMDEPPTGEASRSRQAVLVAGFLVLFGGYLLLGSDDPSRVRRGLQRAYNLETMNYPDQAAEEYAMLRQLLTRRRRDDDPLYGSKKVSELELQATDFVRDRMERLR